MMVDGSINDRMNPCDEGDHPLVRPSIAPSSFAPIPSKFPLGLVGEWGRRCSVRVTCRAAPKKE